MKLTIGSAYNWINQPERLIYMGKKGVWHQFRRTKDPEWKVWCEILTEDLHMIEETKE